MKKRFIGACFFLEMRLDCNNALCKDLAWFEMTLRILFAASARPPCFGEASLCRGFTNKNIAKKDHSANMLFLKTKSKPLGGA
ncbi:MAG TPA: hypothetical protein PKD70_01985 [Saprospiraceae bacterium]|nr:hypothetical protein [Saprospiraceae bacterium]HMP12620.1 hypothetical protein [Saprospiraceae bacterium]